MGAQPLTGCTGWVVTDGHMGTLAATTGIAAALGLEFEHKCMAPRGPWSALPSWSLVDPREHFGRAGSTLSPPWPDVAIAAGRHTIPYLKALRRASEGATFTVLLQHPRTGSDVADLIWCPLHDQLHAANVISTLTSPHAMRPCEIVALRKTPIPAIDALGRPLVAVLLGGPNGVFKFDAPALERLAGSLRSFAAAGARFLITPSQRTTASLFRAVTQATRGANRIVWPLRGVDSYWTLLAHADLTIVTAELGQHDEPGVRHRQARLRVRAQWWLGEICAVPCAPAELWGNATADTADRPRRQVVLSATQLRSQDRG